ncbi:MAG: hypothetical protein EB170_09065, partial [Nitrosopumilaceae archaeon]|nr:hypothetical protein [Nitrosopumilaceae archaeon]
MEIFVLRHGDANSDSKKIIDDSKRVLTDAGIKEVDGVSRFFGDWTFSKSPDLGCVFAFFFYSRVHCSQRNAL